MAKQAVATVANVIGKAFARNENGELRALKVGDTLLEGETLLTSADGRVELSYMDGSSNMTVDADHAVLITAELFDTGQPDAASAAITGATSEQVLQALAEGKDISQVLEAPAAGLVGGAEGEGNSFVRLLRIVEPVDPLAFQFEGAPVTTPPTFEEAAAVVVEPVVSVTVGLEVEIPPGVTPPTEPTPEFPVLVSGNAVSVLEGSGDGSRAITFLITLDKIFDQDVTVTYELRPTSDNDAADYPADWFDGGVGTFTVTIPAGQQSLEVVFNIVEDRIVEENGTFEIVLTDAVNATINPDSNAATVTIFDDDAATVSLGVSPAEITEAGAQVTYTATLAGAVFDNDVTVTLSNGQAITIAAGATSGTVEFTFANSDDVYIDPSSAPVTIVSVNAGEFTDKLTIDGTPATVTIADTIDTTTVSLSVTDVNEDAAGVTFTATLSNPGESAVTVVTNLGNINIAAGETSGTLFVATADPDVYLDPDSITATVSNVTGGNFEAVDFSAATATAQITDTIDTTTVTLGDVTVDEGSGTATISASVNNAVTGSPLIITLDNGATVTIPVGQTSADSTAFAVQGDDPYNDAESYSVAISGTTGGNFEALDTTDTATVTINDTIDTVTATLTASPANIDETGGTITYTVTLTGGPGAIDPDTDLTFNLANGEQVTITAGNTSGSVDHTYTDAEITNQADISNSITGVASGGTEYENLATAGATLVDVDYGPVITDLTPEAEGGDVIVDEDDLLASRGIGEYEGSDSSKESTTATGTFTIAAPDGVDDVTVGGNAVITNGVFTATSFSTALGNTFAATAYNSATGEITYTYTLNDNETHPDANGENSLFENLGVVLTDTDGDSTSATLSVQIVDDVPTLTHIDNAIVANETGSITGNVDVLFGADGPDAVAGLKITGYTDLDGITEVLSNNDTVLTAYIGDTTDVFYTLTLNASDGTYTLDYNERPTVSIPLVFPDAAGASAAETLDATAGTYTVSFNGALWDGTTLVDYPNTNVDDVKTTGTGFGVGSPSTAQTQINNNEGFITTFLDGANSLDVTGFSFSVVNNGNTPSVTVHWKTYNDGVLVDDNSAGTSYDVSTSNQPVPVMIGTGSEFDTVDVWFDGLEAKDVRIESFSLETSIIPEDAPLTFQVAAVDGDGDITASVGFDVLLQGGSGPDYTVSGNADILAGSDGNDTLIGGSADQVLIGGMGDDTLTGDAGADTFKWSFGDEGTPGTVDHITDFNLAPVADGGDALDLGDLLTGESANATSLDAYLNFSAEAVTGNAVITIDVDGAGGGTSGQQIVLDNVSYTDLQVYAGGSGSDADIISKMIDNGNLKTDM